MDGRWAFLLPVLASLAVAFLARQGVTTAGTRLALAGGGLAWMILYGFHGKLIDGRPLLAHGLGAGLIASALVLQGTRALASLGAFKADRWVATTTVTILVLVLTFVFFPGRKCWAAPSSTRREP